ncbi:hypothetical protein [Nocardiopsis halophila]|uniref:hypothetical protein n=1 Tax=Nocardiopsis halophila TaxID=141692 RepID=UPI000344A755|nr:hypothetical protein [Nocardiopsis halophila]
MWFVGSGRTGAAHAEGVAARLRKAEYDEQACQEVLADYDRDHRDLEERVERLEAELAEARRQKLEAFARWWNCREDRDRARHVARRLRRRLERLRRRNGSVPGGAQEGPDAGTVPWNGSGSESGVNGHAGNGRAANGYEGNGHLAHGHPGNGHADQGRADDGRGSPDSGAIPSQREAGASGEAADEERRTRSGWKRVNGGRRRPRE